MGVVLNFGPKSVQTVNAFMLVTTDHSPNALVMVPFNMNRVLEMFQLTKKHDLSSTKQKMKAEWTNPQEAEDWMPEPPIIKFVSAEAEAWMKDEETWWLPPQGTQFIDCFMEVWSTGWFGWGVKIGGDWEETEMFQVEEMANYVADYVF